MNLRGALGDKLMVFAFFFLMVVVGGGIVIGTLFFIGNGYDFRAGDASLLGAKIEKCISEGFNLNELKEPADLDAKLKLLSDECGFNNKVLKSYYKIKICERKNVKNASECVGLGSEKSVFAYGDVQPCKFVDSNKFLGCSRRATSDYIIVSATNQQLRRSAR